jgi:Holliday junction resolvase RusA-like endonuclease
MTDTVTGFTFHIPGPPVPKARPRQGRGGHFYTPATTRAYEELVAWAATAAAVSREGFTRFTEDCRVTITIQSATRMGDLDNIAKSILDGMVRCRLLSDDRIVAELIIRRRFVDERGEERATVTIESGDEL